MTKISHVSISNACLEDLHEILALFRRTVITICKKDYKEDQLDAWASSANDHGKWKRKIEEQLFLLTHVDDRLVGFASLEGSNYLDLFYVHHLHQGKSIGKQLYKNLEIKARKTGASQITADVSITARPFFEKQGFSVVKENAVNLRNQVFTNYTMCKLLL